MFVRWWLSDRVFQSVAFMDYQLGNNIWTTCWHLIWTSFLTDSLEAGRGNSGQERRRAFPLTILCLHTQDKVSIIIIIFSSISNGYFLNCCARFFCLLLVMGGRGAGADHNKGGGVVCVGVTRYRPILMPSTVMPCGQDKWFLLFNWGLRTSMSTAVDI